MIAEQSPKQEIERRDRFALRALRIARHRDQEGKFVQCREHVYCCVMAAIGTGVILVMANFNVTFLRPARAADLIAEVRIVRRGGRLHYLECWLNSDGETVPCAHVTSTYRVSRRVN